MKDIIQEDRMRETDREEEGTQTVDREVRSQAHCLPDRLSVYLQHVKHLTSAGVVAIVGQDDSTVWTTTEASIEKLSVCPCLCIVYFLQVCMLQIFYESLIIKR